MAPTAIYHDQPDVLAKSDVSKVKDMPFTYRSNQYKKPVADDYMYAFKYNAPLPLHDGGTDVIDFTKGDEANLKELANTLVKSLEQIIQAGDAKAFAGLFLDSGKALNRPYSSTFSDGI